MLLPKFTLHLVNKSAVLVYCKRVRTGLTSSLVFSLEEVPQTSLFVRMAEYPRQAAGEEILHLGRFQL